MSTILYDLPDRYVLDTGEVVFKHIRAIRSILAGKSLNQQLVIDSDDLQRFIKTSKQTPIPWNEGEEADPPSSTYDWNIPDSFKNLNLRTFLFEKIENFLMDDESRGRMAQAYVERFETELELIETLHMEDFIRSLIYIADVFLQNNVVWGVGRGSSVESLILFLIGIHRIDPILYGIELEHFYRTDK